MHPARPSLLVLALLVTVGCGGTQRFLIPPGEQLARMESTGLSAEITEIVNSKRKLEVHLQFANEGATEVRFPRAGVAMEFGGRRYEARDLRVWDVEIDLAPGQVISKGWAFHVGDFIAPGTHELRITDIETFDGDTRTARYLEFAVPVTVPVEG